MYRDRKVTNVSIILQGWMESGELSKEYVCTEPSMVVVVVLVTKLWLTLVTPGTVFLQAPLSMGFSRQEHWNGLPFPSPGDLSDPEIKPVSPVLQVDSLLTEPPGKPKKNMFALNPTYLENLDLVRSSSLKILLKKWWISYLYEFNTCL